MELPKDFCEPKEYANFRQIINDYSKLFNFKPILQNHIGHIPISEINSFIEVFYPTFENSLRAYYTEVITGVDSLVTEHLNKKRVQDSGNKIQSGSDNPRSKRSDKRPKR